MPRSKSQITKKIAKASLSRVDYASAAVVDMINRTKLTVSVPAMGVEIDMDPAYARQLLSSLGDVRTAFAGQISIDCPVRLHLSGDAIRQLARHLKKHTRKSPPSVRR